MHLVIARKIDALLGITVGDRILYGWDNTSTGVPVDQLPVNFGASFAAETPTSGYAGFTTVGLQSSVDFEVDKMELFGGDMREGGVRGTVGLRLGEATQVKDPYLQTQFGDFTPAFRGVVSLILKRVYIGVNPYLKNWAFLVRRIPQSDWMPDYASIVAPDHHIDANPAHTLRWLITDSKNMGYSTTKVDATSFEYAAITLFNEGFGLSFLWDRQSSIEEFIQKILNHINGVLVVSRTTGKFELTLLRADYTVGDLPIFDEANIISVDSYQRASWSETVNEVTVRYTDRFTGNTHGVTVQDIANIQVQQSVVNTASDYPGITNGDLAARVAQRDLQILSAPLSKVKFTANRTAWNLKVGDVVVFKWAKLDISSMVVRIGAIRYGTLANRTITIEAAEDVFALPAVSYFSSVQPSIPTSTPSPIPATNQRTIEATFWDVMKRVGTPNALAQSDTAAFLTGVAVKPGSLAASFQFESSGVGPSGPFDGIFTGYFCPSCVTPSLIQELVSTFTYSDDTDMSIVAVGDFGYIDDEVVLISAIDTSTHSITLDRGILDTTPMAHSASRLYVTSSLKAVSTWEYGDGETVYSYIRPQFPLGTLARSDATVVTSTLAGRPNRPYPPGKFRLNGSEYPPVLSLAIDLVITWAHRNRTQQTAYLVLQSEGSITTETSVTYNLTVVNSLLGSLVNQTGLTAATYTYSAADFADAVAASADTDISHYVGSSNTVELWATRGGKDSWQRHTFTYYLLS
ncbi:phage tail protein [Methylovulum miyakonense]|uniref:phage tail protein n=1 Tax=Methylovulum miyakonense TaxID=645578 RepID=UPI00037C8E36|nr:phage tail protein [Methylovulum miyakonense]